MMPPLTPEDRLLLIAPHPDDESLATGGLVQRVEQIGAAGRVLMITNGDNNPWPQRWLEKRWRIGPAERERWGAMRRAEATEALHILGFRGQTEFLGFPDQGVTAALLKNETALLATLIDHLREWRPTFLVYPSAYDQHPDHNALHVLIRVALKRLGMEGLKEYHFAVHCLRRDLVPGAVTLALDECQRQRKYDAIACHKSQMILSSKRFLGYAKSEEGFFEPIPATRTMAHHPLAEAYIERGKLRLSLPLPLCCRGGLWIAGEQSSGEHFRWSVRLPLLAGKVPVTDLVTGERAGEAAFKVSAPFVSFKIPVPADTNLLYVKYHRPAIFLDPSGWREVPV